MTAPPGPAVGPAVGPRRRRPSPTLVGPAQQAFAPAARPRQRIAPWHWRCTLRPAVPVLHPPHRLLSLRHAPSWLLLTMAAGAVNAGAFLACRRFVTHVTGTVTLLGMDAGSSLRLMVDYGVVFACFIAGAMTSVLAIEGRYYRGKTPLHALPLIAVAAILTGVASFGAAGAFGRFGGSVERLPDFVMLSLVSFAMGLQNAAVATSTGAMVRTTHLSGPATDLGVFLATSFFTRGEERRQSLQRALLRLIKIGGFALGAGLMVPAAHRFDYLAFLAPASLVLGATALSFMPSWAPLEAPALAPAPTPSVPAPAAHRPSRRPVTAAPTAAPRRAQARRASASARPAPATIPPT